MGKSINTTYDTIEQIYSESKIIIVGCLASWALCRLRFGCIGLLLVLSICRTYYELTTRRIQRAIRDETRRHHAQRILARGETVHWINELLDRIWHLYERPLCEQIVQHVNAGLSRTVSKPGEPAPQRVVLHSLASIERPLRFNRVHIAHRPDSDTMILEGEFTLHQTAHEPLINLRVHHHTNPHKQTSHDLEIQIREFTGVGILRLEIDCSGSHPAIRQPQIELRGQPKMDCTVKTLSHHNFPFHFAHHVDWRKVVEMQIREGLGRAFKSPLPLPLVKLLGEGLLVKILQWLWQVERYWERHS
ncbi:uncharacterized protein CDV56_101833 [Aspergillus thermomutatus]|uniref:SMP-LTD domain-containing protein n=1 Tax=Aspergillus thermomutatus TaxID=41047 RepID=A0A397H2W1_ASPTH|nr:uncharacterized protein CDV56_101833 [Aspergillus thermomutatus]RHZ57465.1 hypothetical protein CDV56_101833 [Aspergillus thermomutatus]